MKILLTDIFFRKSFDVINILKCHYPKDNFIFTLPDVSRQYRFKLKSIYNVIHFDVLNKNSFNKDLRIISKKYSEEEIVFIPIEEDTIFSFLKFIEGKDASNLKYLFPCLQNFQLSRHKEQLNLYCEKNKIPCPKYISEEIFNKREFKYPIIKKPKQGSGTKGIVYIENEDDLESLNINFETDFVQERLPNSKDVEAGFFLCFEGEIISYYGHKRIRTYPETGGVTVFSKCEYSSEIKKIGSSVIQKLNWSGLLMIEYIYDKRDKTYKLIEINPRLWGSVMLSEFCGADFLKNYVELALDKEIGEPNIDTNVFIRWVFPYDILFWIKNISNPIKFFKVNKNTCYINFSYSSFIRSFLFVVLTYFNFAKIKNIFRNG